MGKTFLNGLTVSRLLEIDSSFSFLISLSENLNLAGLMGTNKKTLSVRK